MINAVAYEVQEAITDVLVSKLLRAADAKQPKSLILAGGVAANTRLREKLLERLTHSSLPITLHLPSRKHSTDNAAMLGAAAIGMLEFGVKPVAPETVDARSNWPLTDW